MRMWASVHGPPDTRPDEKDRQLVAWHGASTSYRCGWAADSLDDRQRYINEGRRWCAEWKLCKRARECGQYRFKAAREADFCSVRAHAEGAWVRLPFDAIAFAGFTGWRES